MGIGEYLKRMEGELIDLSNDCSLCVECCLYKKKKVYSEELDRIIEYLADEGVEIQGQGVSIGTECMFKLLGGCGVYEVRPRACRVFEKTEVALSDGEVLTNDYGMVVYTNNKCWIANNKRLLKEEGHDFHGLELLVLDNYLVNNEVGLTELTISDKKMISAEIVDMTYYLSSYLSSHDAPALSAEGLFNLYNVLARNRQEAISCFSDLRSLLGVDKYLRFFDDNFNTIFNKFRVLNNDGLVDYLEGFYDIKAEPGSGNIDVGRRFRNKLLNVKNHFNEVYNHLIDSHLKELEKRVELVRLKEKEGEVSISELDELGVFIAPNLARPIEPLLEGELVASYLSSIKEQDLDLGKISNKVKALKELKRVFNDCYERYEEKVRLADEEVYSK